jgi:hypothetical protein
MACISDNMGQLMIGNILYQLRPGVGIWKRGSDGGCMGWSGVRGEAVDGVGNSTLAGSTCIGEGGCTTSIGVGGIGAGAGTGAAEGGAGGG